ncbi:hypothetical protein PBY51_007891 [Eleginops maclovinus]|uniref:Uncharacterized protein n=1 Tax=Eleginops maclovinus TaxID=56733 RepID=A0AAN8AIE6_ELEMC|nr:hypothetical protein PBY51_007891 [Eleginops maclovinus]
MPTATYGLQLSRLSPGWRGRFMKRDYCVPGWVLLWSQLHREKLAATQDKHKQGHPLGRLTPRACVGACQPGLWAKRLSTPRRWIHPIVERLHQPAESPLWLREGTDSLDPPTNVDITTQAATG